MIAEALITWTLTVYASDPEVAAIVAQLDPRTVACDTVKPKKLPEGYIQWQDGAKTCTADAADTLTLLPEGTYRLVVAEQRVVGLHYTTIKIGKPNAKRTDKY